MSLRLDAGDLARVRLGPGWGPLCETLFSLRVLRQRHPLPLVEDWQQTVRPQLGHWIAPLLVLTPTSPLIDLHTTVGPSVDMDQALRSLAALPTTNLCDELAPLHPPPTDHPAWVHDWLRSLSRGQPHARHKLVQLLERYHRIAIAPYWQAIHSYLAADRAHRIHTMTQAGIERLLATLHPRVRWRPPILDIHTNHTRRHTPTPRTTHGRPLVLVPSVFCLDGPRLLTNAADPAAPLVLIFPALTDPADAASLWAPQTPPPRAALAKLLGTTRADALHAIANTASTGCTTTGLARHLRVSLATASHHISVLRDACLVTSNRRGATIDHQLTALGKLLVHDRPTNRQAHPTASPPATLDVVGGKF